MFRVDAAHKQLSTFVSNGPTGLDYEKRDFAFEGNGLIVMSEETQSPRAAVQDGLFTLFAAARMANW
jgi:hypothetical protein